MRPTTILSLALLVGHFETFMKMTTFAFPLYPYLLIPSSSFLTTIDHARAARRSLESLVQPISMLFDFSRREVPKLTQTPLLRSDFSLAWVSKHSKLCTKSKNVNLLSEKL